MIYNMGKGGRVNDVVLDGTSALNAQGIANFTSGTNVKTIHGKSIFGSGNLTIGTPITITMTAIDGTTKTVDVLKTE